MLSRQIWPRGAWKFSDHHSHDSPSCLTLHCNQMSLTELCALKIWQVDDAAAMSHVLSPAILERVPPHLQGNFSEVVQLLLKSPGFTTTPSTPVESIDALDIMAGDDVISGPPWKLTDRGHEHLRQCVSLNSGENILKKQPGPIQDLSMYQLVLALDGMGWSHEVVVPDKHKYLRRTCLVHRGGHSKCQLLLFAGPCAFEPRWLLR